MADTRTARAWVNEVFRAVDAKNTGRSCEFLVPDAVFVYGNAAPVEGIPAISQYLAWVL